MLHFWAPQHTEILPANGVLMREQEAVLEVEYFLAVVPPDTQQALPHDDWCAGSVLAIRESPFAFKYGSVQHDALCSLVIVLVRYGTQRYPIQDVTFSCLCIARS